MLRLAWQCCIPHYFLACLAPAGLAHAQATQWTPHGPTSITALAIDPGTASTLYVGLSNGGIAKSTNSGGQWSPVNAGLDDLAVGFLVVDPLTPTTVYATTTTAGQLNAGVYKSTDAGASWSRTSAGLPHASVSLSVLAIDPLDPTTLYVGTIGAGILKSTNGGAAWVAANNGLTSSQIFALAVDPLVSATAYAGTPLGIFKTTDGGASWVQARSGGVVSVLTVAPTTPTTIYAGSFGTVLKSNDAGATWSSIDLGFDVKAIGADPVTPTTVYAGTDGGGIFRSTDSGGSWVPSNSGISEKKITAVAVDRAAAALYAGTRIGGVFKSTNAAAAWAPANAGLAGLAQVDVSALAFDPLASGTIYAAGIPQQGVYKTTNAGATWAGVLSSRLTTVAVDPATPARLFAGGPQALRLPNQIWRSLDGGTTWAIVFPGTDATSIRIHPLAPSNVYFASQGGGVSKSTDSGTSWNRSNAGLSNLAVTTLELHPSVPTTLYAGTLGGGLFESTDGAASWHAINGNGLPDTKLTAIGIVPTATPTLYAGTLTGIYRSSDGGSTWVAMNSGLGSQDVTALAIHPVVTSTMLASTISGGVFLSSDGGQSWSARNAGLTDLLVRSLAFDPTKPATVYAGTRRGVFSLQLEGTLSVTKAGAGTGTVTSSPPGISCGTACTAPFALGSQVTLAAAADSQFDGWSGGGCSGTGACTVTITGATTVNASFGWRPPTASACPSGCTHTTIQAAINASVPGDTVLVRSTYDSIAAGEVFPVTTQAIRSINPAGTIRILGETDGTGAPITTVKTVIKPGQPELDGIFMLSPGAVENLRILPGSGYVRRVIVAGSGNACPGAACHLRGGLAIRNVVIEFSFRAANGLELFADDVLIDRVSVKGITRDSIRLDGDNATIQNSTLDARSLDGRPGGELAIGFRLNKASAIPCSGFPTNYVVKGNTIVGYKEGIQWCSGRNIRIENNTIMDIVGKGIDTSGSQGTQILGNVLQQNTSAGGLGIELSNGSFQACSDNKVAQNKVLGRAARDMQRGISVQGCANTQIILNEVRNTADNSGSIYVSMSPGQATTTVIQGNTVIGGNAAGIVYLGADSGSSVVDRSVIRDNVVNDHGRDGILVRYIKWPRSGIGAGNVVAYNTVRKVNQGGFADTHGINLQDVSGTAFDRNTALDTQAGYGFFLANSTGVNGNCNTGAANAAGLFGQSNVTPAYGNVNVNCRIALYTHYDFLGSGRSDVTVYRHSTGEWFGPFSVGWGSPALDDIPAPANYTQAGKTDVAVYRFSTGDWVIKRSTDGGLTQVKFGEPFVGDIPVPADYDGDGLADLATFRVSTANAEWRIRRSSDGVIQYFAWGCAACADLAVPGDYDGDGKADVAVYRRSTGEWFIRRSSNGSLLQLRWGSPELGDLPVAGRYTTSAMSDVAVYRSLTGDWLIRRSTDAGLTQVVWGSPSTGDFPVPADYSQANVTDIATFRPSDGLWRIRRSSDFQAINYNFGNPALLDAPLTSR